MHVIVIAAKPILEGADARLIIQDDDRHLQDYWLKQDHKVTIEVVNADEKWCFGWYDINSHTNHPCPEGNTVDTKYESCYVCREKTGFNPAFQHSAEMSKAQTEYNKQPHSVYAAYFGRGLVKAGMMADSRGLMRVYEQGALLYSVVGTYDDAYGAQRLEAQLVRKGLKNSVSKRQKQPFLENLFRFDTAGARAELEKTLVELQLESKDAKSNIDHFFFSSPPTSEITHIAKSPISGTIKGLVGRYLVVENNGRLFGFWLDNLYGYEVSISSEVVAMEAEPLQGSLF